MQVDPMWMRSLLVVHIAAGFGSFLLAPVALATAKGGKQHRRWGMVYLWCMGVVAATALPMSLYRPVLFLALVAVFSFYAAFSAYRVLKLKALARDGKATAVDWIAGLITFCASAALAGLGAFRPHAVQNMGIVAIVFGCIGMALALGQLKTFIWKPEQRLFWVRTHIGNFIGSYIAAWSAFSAVTLTQYFGNAWYVWLWPTIVGVPLSAMTVAYWMRKYSGGGKKPEAPAAAIA